MRFGNRHILSLLLIASLSPAVCSQEAVDTVASLPGIEIQTSVDRAEIYIGDLITYKLTIIYDSTYELVPPPLGANLGAFDVKDYQTDIITKLPDGRVQSENIFIVSTFTTGDYIIPPIPALFNLPDGSQKAVLSEGVPIKVLSLLLNADDSVDIKPLKAQYEFERDLTPYYLWGGSALLLLIAIGVLVWMKLRKKKEQAPPVDLRPAWEIAFERLAFLKQKNLVAEETYKEYYIELTDIVRAYYERMYALNVLDMTTEEFLGAFVEQDPPEGLHGQTEQFLNQADLVKFARFVPGKERAESDFDEAHSMIELVRLDFERRQSAEAAASQAVKKSNDVAETEEVAP